MSFFNTDAYGANAKKRAQEEGARLDERETAGQTAFYDHAESDKVKQQQQALIAELGARTAPSVAKGYFGSGAYVDSPTKVGAMSTMTAPTIDRTGDKAMRAQQLEALARYDAAAAGKGPSLAGIKMQSASDQAIASYAAANAAAPRAGAMLAGRSAGNAASGMMAGGAIDSAALKSQEAAAGAKSYAALASGIRASDLGAAAAQAKYQQDAGLFNAAAVNTGTMADASFQQQANIYNALAAQKNADLNQSVELANMQAFLQSRGMNDQQIAMYLSQYQKQFQSDKAAQQSYHEWVADNRQFDAKMDYARLQKANADNDAKIQAGISMMTMGASAAAKNSGSK